MALYVGTHDGLYRAATVPFDEAELVLDRGTVHVVENFEQAGLLAATDEGLYRSQNGREWRNLDVPRDHVVSVAVSPDSSHWYAGTYPARVYRSSIHDGTDGSKSNDWNECEAFGDLPSRERWADRSPQEAGSEVRTLATHPTSPDRIIAGVEVGGVCLSDDRGETWEERSYGVHDDVHHVLALGPDEWIASCGNGLYRTRDAGETWARRDTDFRDFWFNYHREAIHHSGVLYSSAMGWGPEEGRGAIFATCDDGVPVRIGFPSDDSSFVLSWTEYEERLVAGTMGVDERFQQHERANVLVVDDDGEWSVAGTVPAGVKSLATT